MIRRLWKYNERVLDVNTEQWLISSNWQDEEEGRGGRGECPQHAIKQEFVPATATVNLFSYL